MSASRKTQKPSAPSVQPAAVPEHRALQALAKETLRLEAHALLQIADRIDASFAKAVQCIASLKGKLIVSGMGKSGLIAQKIAATLASTGTPAVFMHPSEAAHGDLGMVQQGDGALFLSKSGITEELIVILPVFKKLSVPIVAMVGNLRSTLAMRADVVLDVSVSKEADPFNLAPTTSTTAMLAMGDALAVALMRLKNFSPERFAQFHPSGALGRRLTMRVEEVMATGDRLPLVAENASLREVILEMTAKRFGAALVVNSKQKLSGIFTDGDLRRLMLSGVPLDALKASDVMSRNPKFTTPDTMAKACLETMEQHRITQLPVCDASGKPIGIVHLHDLVSLGL
ncbi:MAG: KpsF/GutQ family sugar-phosphate isomerase [Chloroherpetonaceae bacterium]|nr:KpsF/GutQ family sugar-phosphate isomerase [Chloroherpetonaceae bacterium]